MGARAGKLPGNGQVCHGCFPTLGNVGVKGQASSEAETNPALFNSKAGDDKGVRKAIRDLLVVRLENLVSSRGDGGF